MRGILVLAVTVSITMAGAWASAGMPDSAPPAGEARGVVSPMIAQLEAVKARYEAVAANGGWPAFSKGATIKPNARDGRIPAIRAIVTATGDLEAAASEGSDTALYDDSLQQAVRRFQERHALKADGVIGRDTQDALAAPVERRIAQIQTTLERMKSHDREERARYVLVNVPGFYLQAVVDDKVALTSRVIVGSPKNATPLFSKEIVDVNFNPAWHVPPRIAAHELAVKERDDPGYLERNRFVLKDDTGNAVAPEEVDWENVHRYRFRQHPGAGNALGKIKFNIPNHYNVYLHSTSSPKLFAKEYRALSHGCIRVERTRELAHFALAGMEEWDAARVDKAYDGAASRRVSLKEPIPVYLVYWPVWVDQESGRVHFHPDIYGRDASRVAELMQQREFKLSMNGQATYQ